MSRKVKHKNKKFLSVVAIFIEILAVIILVMAVIHLMKRPDNIIDESDTVESTSENTVEDSIFKYMDRTKQIGEIHTIEQLDKNYVYGIQYPVLGNEKIDQNIGSKVQEMIDLFTLEEAGYQADTIEERAMLTVDYESYVVGNKIVSIVFYILKNDRTNDIPSQSIKSYLYNLDSSSPLGLQDIFYADFENLVSASVFSYFATDENLTPYIETPLLKHNISPLPGNFSSFSLDNEFVVFYFGSGALCPGELGLQKAVISRVELESVLSIDSSGNTKELVTPTEASQPELPEETTTVPITEPTPSASIETEPQITLEAPTTSVELDLSRPMIAFTFDDGPYTPVTGRILDVLEANNSKATFFVVGNRLNNYKETLARIYALGCQIGNHSYSHKSFDKIPANDVLWQIAYTNDLIEGIIGTRTSIVRVPYGAYQGQVSLIVKYPMIQWNVDTLDWKTKNKDAIVAEVLRTVKDGNVILMHDLYPSTADAFEVLVPLLISQGYQLVTVSDLYAAKGIPLEPGKVYFNTN